MSVSFDGATLELLRAVEEPEIETSAAPGATRHRTIIWVVVDEHDRVFIRSVRGAGARWYREALAQPVAVLYAEGRAIDVSVEPAADPERIAACSRWILSKYAGQYSARAMVAEHTLETTLELLPR
jgi:hypothetical protein